MRGEEFVRVLCTSPPLRYWSTVCLYIRARDVCGVCVYHSLEEYNAQSIPALDAHPHNWTVNVLPVYEVQVASPIFKYQYFIIHPDDRQKMQLILNATDVHLERFTQLMEDAETGRKKKMKK